MSKLLSISEAEKYNSSITPCVQWGKGEKNVRKLIYSYIRGEGNQAKIETSRLNRQQNW